MMELENALGYIRGNTVLSINRVKFRDMYSGCLIKYDGRILKDVIEVNCNDIEKLLEKIPNIKEELDKYYIYQIAFNYETRKYKNTILEYIRVGGYKEPYLKEEVISDESEDLKYGMMELDRLIKEKNNKEKRKYYSMERKAV